MVMLSGAAAESSESTAVAAERRRALVQLKGVSKFAEFRLATIAAARCNRLRLV
jgi:hypothetical protein